MQYGSALHTGAGAERWKGPSQPICQNMGCLGALWQRGACYPVPPSASLVLCHPNTSIRPCIARLALAAAADGDAGDLKLLLMAYAILEELTAGGRVGGRVHARTNEREVADATKPLT